MANSHILVGAITNPLQPVVRRISTSDIYYALARGYDDMAAFPSYADYQKKTDRPIPVFLVRPFRAVRLDRQARG